MRPRIWSGAIGTMTRSVPSMAIDEPTTLAAGLRGWTLSGGLLMLWGIGFLAALLPTILGFRQNGIGGRPAGSSVRSGGHSSMRCDGGCRSAGDVECVRAGRRRSR